MGKFIIIVKLSISYPNSYHRVW